MWRIQNDLMRIRIPVFKFLRILIQILFFVKHFIKMKKTPFFLISFGFQIWNRIRGKNLDPDLSKLCGFFGFRFATLKLRFIRELMIILRHDEREKNKNMMSKNIIAETSLNNKVTLNYFWPHNRIRIRHSEMAKFDINYFPF